MIVKPEELEEIKMGDVTGRVHIPSGWRLVVHPGVDENSRIQVYNFTKGKDGDDNKFFFAGDYDGFEQATDKWESLIRAEEEEKSGKKDESEKLPPIGILDYIKKKKNWRLLMQDGRSGIFKVPVDLTIEKNVIEVAQKAIFFEKGEKYFIDTIAGKDNTFAVYPFGDLEQGGDDMATDEVGEQDFQDIEEGKTPIPKEGDGEQKDGEGEGGEGEDGKGEREENGDGGEKAEKGGKEENGDEKEEGKGTPEKPPTDLKEKLARIYKFDSYEALMDYYDNEPEELIKELYGDSEATIEAIGKELGIKGNVIKKIEKELLK